MDDADAIDAIMFRATTAEVSARSAEHLELLKQGVKVWNSWRANNQQVVPQLARSDLSGLDLSKANLKGAVLCGARLCKSTLFETNLRRADLSGANLRECVLWSADLSGSLLRKANLSDANLSQANLRGAQLQEAQLQHAQLSAALLTEARLRSANLHSANLIRADLHRADLGNAILVKSDLTRASGVEANLVQADLRGCNAFEADLTRANLSRACCGEANFEKAKLVAATLVETDLTCANLTGCQIYGLSVWGAKLEGAVQSNLVITPPNSSSIEIDSLEVAQFIYLLLNNSRIRQVIDAITSKVVLILGRFTPERKPVLDAIRKELRSRNYLPVLFDFEKPNSRDLTETVSTLAHMARFVIADITDAKSIPQELMRIVPALPSVPVQPLLHSSQSEYGMFEHFRRFPWVLKPVIYDDQPTLLLGLAEAVIAPIEELLKQQTQREHPAQAV